MNTQQQQQQQIMGCIQSEAYHEWEEHLYYIHGLSKHPSEINYPDHMNCSKISIEEMNQYQLQDLCKQFYEKGLGYFLFDTRYKQNSEFNYIHLMNNKYKYMITNTHDRCVGKDINMSFDNVLVLRGKKCFVYYFKGDADLIDMEINRQKLQEELQFIKSFSK